MKYISQIFVILIITFVGVSCDHDAENYIPGEMPSAGSQGVYFASQRYINTVELEPGTSSFEVTLTRIKKEAAGTVNLTVLNNEEEVFVVPATASFEAGEETTSVAVTFPTAKEGIQYNLKLTVEGDNVNPYANGYMEIEYNLSILKWESIGRGYMLDGTVSTFFGVDPKLPLAVDIEKTVTATSTRFRFDSPFAKAGEEQDENGGYLAYPYNGAQHIVPGEYTFVIDVTNDGATLFPLDMGMNRGYGMFSCGSRSEYFGTLKGDVITFPAGSLYVSMSEYNGGKQSAAANATYIYLTAEAYLESLETE